MLTRTGPDSFSADSGSTVTIVVRSDDGAPSAVFRYLKKLTTQTIGGNPGCTFTVVDGPKFFSSAVLFGTGPAPRYDFFEVDGGGNLQSLSISATPGTTGPSLQFSIDGQPVMALAAARPAKKAKGAKKRAKAKGTRTKGAKKTKDSKKTKGRKKGGARQ
jgi:hypothetical protein